MPYEHGWRTRIDLDFTAQANQTLGSDTSYTVGGLTWNKINSANDATAMAIVNGTGLNIIPVANTDYFNNTRTCPALVLPLQNVIPKYDLTMGIRLTAYVTDNATANYDNAILSLESFASGTIDWAFANKRGFGTAGPSPGNQRIMVINGTNAFAPGGDGGTDNVIILEVPRVNGKNIYSYSGTYSSGYPSLASLRIIDPLIGNPSANTFSISDLGAPSTWNIFLGSQRAGSPTNLTTTFKRLKIEYLI